MTAPGPTATEDQHMNDTGTRTAARSPRPGDTAPHRETPRDL